MELEFHSRSLDSTPNHAQTMTANIALDAIDSIPITNRVVNGKEREKETKIEKNKQKTEGKKDEKKEETENRGEMNILSLIHANKGGEPEMNKGQKQFIEYVKQGKNIFLTGPPGTGKSFAVKHFLSTAPVDTTGITGSTGLAGVSIGGTTLHSFAGIGLGDGTIKEITMKMGKDAKRRWQTTKLLFIDEISMINGDLLDKIEELARVMRKNTKPFGGIQLVLCGDFSQLPPVKSKKYAFEASCWKRCIDVEIELEEVVRQSDKDFITLLQEMRNGSISTKSTGLLTECENRKFETTIPGLIPTKLNCLRNNVDRDNEDELSKLPGKSFVFESIDSGPRMDLLKDCPSQKTLVLKVGAIVMLRKNLDTGLELCNGTRGVVTKIINLKEFKLKEARDKIKDEILLKDTIAKIQDEKINHGGRPVGSNNIVPKQWFPVVKFECGIEMIMEPAISKIEASGSLLAKRIQIPLNLGWAITIHKSQGMTLNTAIVDLNGCFETGMAYVAVSRLKTLQGLKLIGFKSHFIQTDVRVLAYYRRLKEEKNKLNGSGTGSGSGSESTSESKSTMSMSVGSSYIDEYKSANSIFPGKTPMITMSQLTGKKRNRSVKGEVGTKAFNGEKRHKKGT